MTARDLATDQELLAASRRAILRSRELLEQARPRYFEEAGGVVKATIGALL